MKNLLKNFHFFTLPLGLNKINSKIEIPCQRNNYLKLQNNYMYVLNISRFQLSDILVFIAVSTTLTLRTRIDDITGFEWQFIFGLSWSYMHFYMARIAIYLLWF